MNEEENILTCEDLKNWKEDPVTIKILAALRIERDEAIQLLLDESTSFEQRLISLGEITGAIKTINNLLKVQAETVTKYLQLPEIQKQAEGEK